MTFSSTVEPPLTRSMLYSMRRQLPGLHDLTLTVCDPTLWMAAEGIHRELGQTTQLTRLCLHIPAVEVSSCSYLNINQGSLLLCKKLQCPVLSSSMCLLARQVVQVSRLTTHSVQFAMVLT